MGPLFLDTQVPIEYVGAAVLGIAGPLISALAFVYKGRETQWKERLEREMQISAKSFEGVDAAASASLEVVGLGKGILDFQTRVFADVAINSQTLRSMEAELVRVGKAIDRLARERRDASG